MIAVEVSKHAKDFDCASCQHRHCGDGRTGDNGPAAYDKWEIPGVITSRACLLPMLTADSYEWLRMYRHYLNGVLAVAGGLLDQPAAYLRAMETIDRGKS